MTALGQVRPGWRRAWRHEAGRRQAPRSARAIKNPGCPGRAAAGRAGPGDRPGRRRCAAAVPAGSAGVLPGRFLRPWRARHGFVSPVSRRGDRVTALGQLNMDPPQPLPSQGDGAFLAGLPAAAIDALVAVAGPDAGPPLSSVEVRHLGGALARPAAGGGAQPRIDASYLLSAAGATPTPHLATAVRTHVQAVKDALAPWHASYDYYNFEQTPAPASAVLPPASYRRLQQIKAAHDPDRVIISAHPAWPARP